MWREAGAREQVQLLPLGHLQLLQGPRLGVLAQALRVPVELLAPQASVDLHRPVEGHHKPEVEVQRCTLAGAVPARQPLHLLLLAWAECSAPRHCRW